LMERRWDLIHRGIRRIMPLIMEEPRLCIRKTASKLRPLAAMPTHKVLILAMPVETATLLAPINDEL
jgi:hypothetical protein